MKRHAVSAMGATLGLIALMSIAPAVARDPDCPYSSGNCVTIAAPREMTPEEKLENDRRIAADREQTAARQREIDVEIARLGQHRRAEAERNVELRHAAQSARPNFTNTRVQMCDFPAGSWSIEGIGETVEGAQADIRRAMPNICSATGHPRNPAGTIVGSFSCSPPRTSQIGSNTFQTQALCSATYSCSARRLPCPAQPSAPARATQQ